MTQTSSNQVKPVIKFVNDSSEIRVCFKSSRAVSTIQKMPNGRYVVVKVYEEEVTECDKYSEAKQEAESAAMLPATTHSTHHSKENPDLKVCYKAGRAISTIHRMPDGKFQVIKLYEEKATAHYAFAIAEEVATNAEMKQAPRTKKDAA
jgi:ribosomal protein L34E